MDILAEKQLPVWNVWYFMNFSKFETGKHILSMIIDWLVVGPPLWKILVNWDDYAQYMGK